MKPRAWVTSVFRPINFTLSTDHNPNLRQIVRKLNALHYKAASPEELCDSLFPSWKNNLVSMSIQVKSRYSYINTARSCFLNYLCMYKFLVFFLPFLLKQISSLIFKSLHFDLPLYAYSESQRDKWRFLLWVLYRDLELSSYKNSLFQLWFHSPWVHK